ncbi:MAG: hypothetical protein E7B21_09460 [Staphylococcus epidermidis]|nr:hypothetical protein [Staphylococcus epidermidis]
MSIREKLVIELMNLKDTVKYELSELNEQQYLFMNGPAPHHDYQKQIQSKQFSLQEDIIHQINQSKDFESFLSTYYVNKGKYDIISKIQTFL